MQSLPHLRQLIMLAAGLFAVTIYAQEDNVSPHDARILKMDKMLANQLIRPENIIKQPR
jgi:hypothetical protein